MPIGLALWSGRPRDKAKAESGVLVVERWILAALRHRTFFSVGELNEAIAELLVRLNNRTFRKLPGNRRQRFEELDRPALGPLCRPNATSLPNGRRPAPTSITTSSLSVITIVFPMS